MVKPLELYTDVVRPDWIDYNGHMNVAYYVLAFDFATDALWDYLGLTDAYRDASGQSTFAAEEHVTYQREVREGDPLRFSCQLVAWDKKRIHHFHRMYHADEGYLAATIESMSLCVDLKSRRVTEFGAEIQSKLHGLMAEHQFLPRPEQLGRVIQVKNPVLPS